MTFEINGAKGNYDNINMDESVKYGMNAASNHKQTTIQPMVNGIDETAPILDFVPSEQADKKNIELVEDFLQKNDKYLESLPPLEYEYRYMPNFNDGKINKKALFGAALEEMGQPEMQVKDFEETFLLNKENMTAEPLDIDKNGKIDIPEYSTTILAADMLSKGDDMDMTKIDGSMNSKGMNAILDYTKKSNADAASKMYSEIYNNFELNKLED